MKIIQPSFTIEDPLTQEEGIQMLKRIERAGRTCYKSEKKITDTSYTQFIKNILARGHDSVIEHEKATARIICDRGVSHEIVRHRIASYSQESTRFCNYAADQFDNELVFICPSEAFNWDPITSRLHAIWFNSMSNAEANYFELISYGATPQEARGVLPNSLKTELVMTMNLREWRWFFIKRTANDSHPQIRQIAKPMLLAFRSLIPIVFDDVGTV